MEAVIQFIVLVAATIVSGSAVYVAREAQSIAQTIEENEQRSRKNRRYLMGDPPSGRSVIERLRNLEDKTND